MINFPYNFAIQYCPRNVIKGKQSFWLKRGSKVFGCFLDAREAFDTAWIDGLLYKLFTEFDIRGRIWLAIKDL